MAGPETRPRDDLHPGGAELGARALPGHALLGEQAHREVDGRARRRPAVEAALLLALRPRAGEGLDVREHRAQAIERDGLADEVEGAALEALARLPLGGDAGDGDDGHPRVADRGELEEVESAHPGQADVEQDRVRLLAHELFERVLRARDGDGLVPEAGDEVAEDVAEGLLVLDDQHPQATLDRVLGHHFAESFRPIRFSITWVTAEKSSAPHPSASASATATEVTAPRPLWISFTRLAMPAPPAYMWRRPMRSR